MGDYLIIVVWRKYQRPNVGFRLVGAGRGVPGVVHSIGGGRQVDVVAYQDALFAVTTAGKELVHTTATIPGGHLPNRPPPSVTTSDAATDARPLPPPFLAPPQTSSATLAVLTAALFHSDFDASPRAVVNRSGRPKSVGWSPTECHVGTL